MAEHNSKRQAEKIQLYDVQNNRGSAVTIDDFVKKTVRPISETDPKDLNPSVIDLAIRSHVYAGKAQTLHANLQLEKLLPEIDDQKLVAAMIESESWKEVSEKTGLPSRKLAARAKQLRLALQQLGLDLPRYKRGRKTKPIDVAALAELLKKHRDG